ncbi:MAG: winged helix DNA-binding protein [Pseudomonadota bacterium]|nr:winged helix DNA-binding protein [Pseudomonadota bacterium]
MKPKTEIEEVAHEQASERFVELFYPIHYAIGMQVEDALRGDQGLDRHQTVIMWLLRSEGVERGGKSLKRKEIERCLTSWYDITSSTVSKALRALAKPPYNFIVISEDPESGREKLVTVTPAGQRYYKRMAKNASEFVKLATDRMSVEENSMGIHMFKVISDTFQQLRDEGRIDFPQSTADVAKTSARKRASG